MSEEIEIVEYDPMWPALYEQERIMLAEALGLYAIDVQHVGSTSVPGLAAKPIVDIAVVIEQYPLPDDRVAAIVALGYEHMGEFGIPRRHYFRKGPTGTLRTHHVHVIELTNPEWENFILFRDYLRAHADVAQEYARLKKALAAQYTQDRVTYTESKAPFIKDIMGRAKE
jgi:GrpB-like predicted nucleotidyltransferase (UPF0157 family)